MTLSRIAGLVVLSTALTQNAFAQAFTNLDFEQSIVSKLYWDYGFWSGTANVPGWTAYPSFYGNYLGGTTIDYNNQPLDGAGICLNGPDYLGPFQGITNYSVLLFGGTMYSQDGTNGAAIGQTAHIPLSAKSIFYWGLSWNSLQITFNGHPLSFFPTANRTNYTIYAADISEYAGEMGELLFRAYQLHFGMIDNIHFSTQLLPKPTLHIEYAGNWTITWPSIYSTWVLESATRLDSAGNWNKVTNTPFSTPSLIYVFDTATNTSRYYRLRYQ